MTAHQDLFTIVTDLGQAIQAATVYPESHRRVHDLLARLHRRLQSETERIGDLNMGFLGDHVVVDTVPFVGLNPSLERLIRRMRERGIEKITFRAGITFGELKRFAYFVATGKEETLERKWEAIAYGRIQNAADGADRPEELSAPPSRSHILAGAASVFRDLLTAMADGKKGRVAEGRDLVAAVMQGLRDEGFVIDRLIRLQSHDDYTVTHSLNVCVIGVAQAVHWGLPENRVHEVGLAALLHDIGKEFVPAEILNKPGRLSSEEFDRMGEHPIIGANILRRIDCGSDVPMVVAFEHHIKHDRSGYPKTLFGGALHPASRMVQIADVYDAMRTERPYRRSIDLPTVLGILRQGRGTEFEPRLLDGFFDLLSRDPEIGPVAAAEPPGLSVRPKA